VYNVQAGTYPADTPCIDFGGQGAGSVFNQITDKLPPRMVLGWKETESEGDAVTEDAQQ
jgi:hypothetical protein